MAKKVLIVEEERDIASLLEMHVSDLGCECETIANKALALEKAFSASYDLIILDVMFPNRDWLDICRELRAEGKATPTLLIASRAEQDDLVRCLEAGVDDYLTKPFRMRELKTRVKSILRRKEIASSDSFTGKFHVGRLTVDIDARKAALAGKTVDLTAREFDVLASLTRFPGRTVRLTDLYRQVWGETGEYDILAVQTYIHRLRAKIEEDPSYPQYLQSVPGVGYRIAVDLD